MVDIPKDRVAGALHKDASELPTGHEEDITTAEAVIEQYVEPHTGPDEQDAMLSAAVNVAAAFIAGTEGDAPISSVSRDTGSVSIDVGNMSDEARDHWARAQMIDPTDQLSSAGEDTASFSFSSLGSQTGQE